MKQVRFLRPFAYDDGTFSLKIDQNFNGVIGYLDDTLADALIAINYAEEL